MYTLFFVSKWESKNDNFLDKARCFGWAVNYIDQGIWMAFYFVDPGRIKDKVDLGMI